MAKEIELKKVGKEEGISILDEEYFKKLNRKTLSPSLVSKWLESPGDWFMDTFVMEKVQVERPIHFERGSWFHRIMEKFYTLPQEERTYENIKKVTRDVTQNEYPQIINSENKEWLMNCLRGFHETWFPKAKDEKIAKIFMLGESSLGLEFKVNGKLGNTKRRCYGLIDKMIEGEYGLIIQDWKTGKEQHLFNPKLPISSNNSFDLWRQQIFYTLMLEDEGIIVESGSLLFPIAKEKEVVVDVNNHRLRNQCIKDFELVDQELEKAIENNFFPFKKGKYNGWASFLCGLGHAKEPNIHKDKLYEILRY